MSAAPLSGPLTGSLLAASSGPLDQIAARMFIAIAVIVLVARLARMGMRKLGQPVVLGEILAGISLGPSLLGLFPGQLSDRLFPLEVRPYLRVAAELGLVIFMFVVGLEIDPEGLRRSGRRAAVLSLSSIAVPMAGDHPGSIGAGRREQRRRRGHHRPVGHYRLSVLSVLSGRLRFRSMRCWGAGT